MNKISFEYLPHSVWVERSEEMAQMLETGRIPLCTLPDAVWYGLDDEGTLCVWDYTDGLVACWESGEWKSYIGSGL